jgi:hypothetical protein
MKRVAVATSFKDCEVGLREELASANHASMVSTAQRQTGQKIWKKIRLRRPKPFLSTVHESATVDVTGIVEV